MVFCSVGPFWYMVYGIWYVVYGMKMAFTVYPHMFCVCCAWAVYNVVHLFLVAGIWMLLKVPLSFTALLNFAQFQTFFILSFISGTILCPLMAITWLWSITSLSPSKPSSSSFTTPINWAHPCFILVIAADNSHVSIHIKFHSGYLTRFLLGYYIISLIILKINYHNFILL